MKACVSILSLLLLVGLVSIKVALAVAVPGSALVLCLWINRRVRVPSKSRAKKLAVENGVYFPSYDEMIERDTIY